MYTTNLKRFARNLNIFKSFDKSEKEIFIFHNKIINLIRKKNFKKLNFELENYIKQISYKKNKFNSKEISLIKESINNIFSKKKENHIVLKEVKNNIGIISISGFGYSGTGAIHDFLRDTNCSIDVLEGRELDLFKYQFSLIEIYKKSCSTKNKIKKQDILKFIFSHILGLPFPGGVNSDEINNRLVGSKALLKAALRLPEDKYRTELIKDICLFMNQISYISNLNKTKKKVEIISRNLINNFGRYYKKKYPNKKYMILNNWIPASCINLSNLLPIKSKIIICTRNAIDAYYSWSIECLNLKYNYKILIFPYLILYFYRHIDFSRNFKLLNKYSASNIYFIHFEDFIFKNTKTTGKLFYKNFFDIEFSSNFKFQKFDPTISKRNVGIYTNNENSIILKYISIKFNQILNKILLLMGYWQFYKK